MNKHTTISASVSEYDDDEIVNPSNNPHIEGMLSALLSRRTALRGLGASAALMSGVGMAGCGGGDDDNSTPPPPPASSKLNFKAVPKSMADLVAVPEGYQISVLHALGDPMKFGDESWKDNGSETPESYQNRIGDGHDGMVFFGMKDEGKYAADHSDRGLLCVNHEYVVTPFVLHPAGKTAGDKRVASEVDKEILAHGVSVVEVKRKSGSMAMEMVRGSRFNRRITSATEMTVTGPARGNDKLRTKWSAAGTKAFGTNKNCACGYTPWGTYLTCEENYLNVLGRGAADDAKRSASEIVALKRYGLPENRKSPYLWDTAGTDDKYARFNSAVSANSADEDFRNEFNTFGWVVEIDPFNPDSTPAKRTHLGRFNHEGAWPAPAEAGKPIVIYSGDDARNEYIYKFVSKALWNAADVNGGLEAGAKYLDEGTLYVAKFYPDGTGEWLELSFGKHGLDANNTRYPFANQGDVVMHCRLAADFRGATKMDRPEWGGVNPKNHEVYMTMTNNSNRVAAGTTPTSSQSVVDAANPRPNNQNGQIIRWKEQGNQAATSFTWDVYLFGARVDAKQNENLSGLTNENDFSSPDGLFFDSRGLLWVQTDDGAYTDVTNCMMLACLPGQVGDGGKVTAAGGAATIKGANATPDTVRRFLVGPKDCEITGITVTPDGKTLMFNVQHPGEEAADYAAGKFSSNWPGNQGYGGKRPRSATVVVTRKDGGTIGI